MENQMALQPVNQGVAVIGPSRYCSPHAVDLAITWKVFTMSPDNFAVTDVNGWPLFKVKRSVFSLWDRRVLFDGDGIPLVTLRRKMSTLHQRWKVFRGKSVRSSDLIFSVKKSSVLQIQKELDVFLAGNTRKEVCDFKVKGSLFGRSCIVYEGESTTIVAQMLKKRSVQSLLLGKDKLMVTVHPNVDYAFIVALIVILDAEE